MNQETSVNPAATDQTGGLRVESDLEARRRRPLPLSLRFGVGAVLLIVMIAILGPYMAPYDPVNGDMTKSLAAPSWSHLMGTDLYGRDMFSRVLYGARIALGLSISVVLLALVFGTLCGLVAGFFGGLIETILMRIVDVVISFPSIVLVIAVLAALGQSLSTIIVAIAVVDWTTYARLIHSQVLSVREREFVEACRACGMSPARILLRHILPNVALAAVVYATLDVCQVILAVSSLSFLGLGAQPPTPDWGYMINEGRGFTSLAWWISTFPGLAVLVTGLAFSFLGDGLADTLNTRR
ncbi:MAG: ABC transporter permease [Chloroflexota bacterium]